MARNHFPYKPPTFDYTINDNYDPFEHEIREYSNFPDNRRVLFAPSAEPWPVNPRLSLLALPNIIDKIFSFLNFTELLTLHRQYLARYRLHRDLGEQCSEWQSIRYFLKNSKSLSFALHEESLYEPEQLYTEINNLIDPTLILTLDISASYDFRQYGCRLAGYNYNFSTFCNLKRLTVREMPFENVILNYSSLIYVRLINIYTEFHTSFQRAFEMLCTESKFLRHLEVSEVPHLSTDFQLPSLLHLTIASDYLHLDTIRNFLVRCRTTLQSLTLDTSGSSMCSLLDSFVVNNVTFPHLRILSFNLAKFFSLDLNMRSCQIHFSQFNFPRISHLCLGVDGRLDIAKYIDNVMHTHLGIMFKPTSDFFKRDELNGQIFQAKLRELSILKAKEYNMVAPLFTYLNVDFHKTFFDSASNIIPLDYETLCPTRRQF